MNGVIPSAPRASLTYAWCTALFSLVLSACGASEPAEDSGCTAGECEDAGGADQAGSSLPNTLPEPPTSYTDVGSSTDDTGPHVIPLSCWSRTSACSPVTNEGCTTTPGESCDFGQDASGNLVLQCYPPPNDATLGDVCNSVAGPYCVPGTRCLANTCVQSCCSASDCVGSDETCAAANSVYGTLGTCSVSGGPIDPNPPRCAERNDFCRVNVDCCQRLCVDGRCD